MIPVYAYSTDQLLRRAGWDGGFDVLADPRVVGAVHFDRPGDGVSALVQACRRHGKDLIFGWRCRQVTPEALHPARSHTEQLALGNTKYNEWRGGASEARKYLLAADELGFRWVCALTHRTLLEDMKAGGALKAVLGDTLCLCLCGYMLVGYLYDIPVLHEGQGTTLSGRDLERQYGLTGDSLRTYLDGMNVCTGVNWSPGLEAGMWGYAQRLGFSGVVVGLPFNLDGMDEVRLKPDDTPSAGVCGGAPATVEARAEAKPERGWWW